MSAKDEPILSLTGQRDQARRDLAAALKRLQETESCYDALKASLSALVSGWQVEEDRIKGAGKGDHLASTMDNTLKYRGGPIGRPHRDVP